MFNRKSSIDANIGGTLGKGSQQVCCVCACVLATMNYCYKKKRQRQAEYK